jgi:O-antigen ligase
MTAHFPMTAQPLEPASVSVARVGTALDRMGYVVLCLFVFSIPWEETLPMLGRFLLASWIGLFAFGIVILRTAICRRVRKLSPLHYAMLALVAWSALSLFWTADWGSTVSRVGTYVQLLVLVWLIWEVAATDTRVLGLLQSYVFGALVCSLSTIRNFMIGRTATQLAADSGLSFWETSRYSISGINANDLGLIIALSVPMLVYLLASPKGRLVKALCWLQLVAGFTAILLTGSRGSLLAAVVGLVMLPLTMSRLPRWQRLGSLIACAGLVACSAYLVPLDIWRRIIAVGSELSQGTLTNRTTIWTAGLEAFRDHAFLGVGSGAYGFTIMKVADFSYITGSASNAVAHNTFVSVLVELGVVGALLLFALLAGLYYCASRMRSLDRRLWITLLLTWTVGVSALTWEYRKPTWLVFGLLAAHAYSQRRAGRAQPVFEITPSRFRSITNPVEGFRERMDRGVLVGSGRSGRTVSGSSIPTRMRPDPKMWTE